MQDPNSTPQTNPAAEPVKPEAGWPDAAGIAPVFKDRPYAELPLGQQAKARAWAEANK